jgi:DNA/RNA-binding domain of Phe-tRNA-synthetase-like protein
MSTQILNLVHGVGGPALRRFEALSAAADHAQNDSPAQDAFRRALHEIGADPERYRIAAAAERAAEDQMLRKDLEQRLARMQAPAA